MTNFRIRLSLRYKLLFLLTTLPLLSLALYLVMATDLFEKDKIAYVYDSSAAVSRGLATQIRIEAGAAYGSLRSIVEHYDAQKGAFSETGESLFSGNPKVLALLLFRRNTAGQYVKLGQLAKDGKPATDFSNNLTGLAELRDRAILNSAHIVENPSLSGGLNLAFRLGEKQDPEHLIVMALYKADDLLNAFQSKSLYSSLVVTRDGQLAIGLTDMQGADLSFLNPVLRTKANEGTLESTHKNKDQSLLISYASVGMGDLRVVSMVKKSVALKAVQVLITKSLLFFVALLASTLFVSVIVSGRLTRTLIELYEATKRVAQGDFNVSVKSRSKDEVGGLAESFTWMAAEVSRLMSETAEKARMQNELATVKTVQETLFPAAQWEFGRLSVEGYFEPASECGGDWWNYSRVGNKIYLWIGDATGHGASAALITSAARSAASVIEDMPNMTPAKAMSILNRAIHMTSKGQVMMTFFIASIDLEQNRFSYACASHDPPYLLHRRGETLSKADLKPLNEVNGPRLGERRDFDYEDVEVEFSPGDMLFFYTDGVLDVQNPEGKRWGERMFLKSLVNSANCSLKLSDKVQNLRKDVADFRLGSELVDDVTFIMCQYEDLAV